jgi:hypothetical protein
VAVAVHYGLAVQLRRLVALAEEELGQRKGVLGETPGVLVVREHVP